MESTTSERRTIYLSGVDDYLETSIQSFLIDRRSNGASASSITFYTRKLRQFMDYCDTQLIKNILDIKATHIREYLLGLEQSGHNPGGCHCAYRALKAFLFWWEREVEIDGWHNPIRKVRGPRVAIEPLDPVSFEDIKKLLVTCFRGTVTDKRDIAIMLVLLDTGVRAHELLNINLEDLDLNTGSVMIRRGKGRKPRMVYLGKKSRKAIRAYLRDRQDDLPYLWTANTGVRFTYAGLRSMLIRRIQYARLESRPTLHSFRRAFALNFLRNNPGDIYSLQRLMGHADLSVLRRYLAQTDEDIREAHLRGGPVDHSDL
jgi:integrase/recombinase XerD